MNTEDLLTFTNLYFLTHLDKEYWTGLSLDTKTASITMAGSDICTELGVDVISAESLASQKAVAEQAVFLARNYESLTENKIIKSESLDGVGSQSF